MTRLTRLPPVSRVFLAGALLTHVWTTQWTHAAASEKSIQLPPPENPLGHQGGSSEIMLEEEYAPPPAHTQTKKADHGKAAQVQAPFRGASGASDQHHEGERAAEEHEPTGDTHFGEALVEGSSGARSVSSTSGLIWFSVVFVILVGFIYLLT
jgi:hypothetical protein